MTIKLKAIGTIHTPFKTIENMPIQPSAAKHITGTIEIFPEYAEGLSDLDGFSHIYVIFHLHRSSGHKLKVIPFLDTVERGVFATRSPARPGAVGLSVTEIVSVNGNIIEIRGVDMLDGSPVIDIKPYVPEFDEYTEIRKGWLEGKAGNAPKTLSDERFK
jgi:tRNA-Thr(GGU) m(6)t(6)A37 methyltransferase TsaA